MDLGDVVVVEDLAVAPHAVGHDLEQLAREAHLGAVGEMAPVSQLHPHDLVPRLEKREVGGDVGLGAGVRLDVDVIGPKESLGPLDGELLHDVDVLAAAVVAAAGVALGVLVRQHGPLRLQHGAGDDVLAGDQLDPVLLAAQLPADRVGQLGVRLGEGGGEEAVRDRVGGGGLVHRASGPWSGGESLARRRSCRPPS